MSQLRYYKMRLKFMTKCVRVFIKKCDSFITNAKFIKNASVQGKTQGCFT